MHAWHSGSVVCEDQCSFFPIAASCTCKPCTCISCTHIPTPSVLKLISGVFICIIQTTFSAWHVDFSACRFHPVISAINCCPELLIYTAVPVFVLGLCMDIYIFYLFPVVFLIIFSSVY